MGTTGATSAGPASGLNVVGLLYVISAGVGTGVGAEGATTGATTGGTYGVATGPSFKGDAEEDFVT